MSGPHGTRRRLFGSLGTARGVIAVMSLRSSLVAPLRGPFRVAVPGFEDGTHLTPA
jgi:hypothetical protein